MIVSSEPAAIGTLKLGLSAGVVALSVVELLIVMVPVYSLPVFVHL